MLDTQKRKRWSCPSRHDKNLVKFISPILPMSSRVLETPGNLPMRLFELVDPLDHEIRFECDPKNNRHFVGVEITISEIL
jgi:hypothetical protein